MLRRDKTLDFRNLSYHGFIPLISIETPSEGGPQYLKILGSSSMVSGYLEKANQGERDCHQNMGPANHSTTVF